MATPKTAPPVKSRADLIRSLDRAWDEHRIVSLEWLLDQCWRKWQLDNPHALPSLPLPERMRSSDKRLIAAHLLWIGKERSHFVTAGMRLWREAVESEQRAGNYDEIIDLATQLAHRIMNEDYAKKHRELVEYILKTA